MMPLDGFRCDLFQSDAADARRRVREVCVDEVPLEPDRFEDLRTSIALQCRDAHFRHDFQHTLLDGLRVMIHGLTMVDARQQALPDHVVQRFECEIWIDRGRAVADQQAIVMDFARIAGFDDQCGLRARAFANEVVMQSGGGKQARNRRMVFIDLAIRQNQDRCAGPDRVCCQLKQIVKRAAHALAAFSDSETHGKRDGAETGNRDVAQLRQIIVIHDRREDLDHPAALRNWLQ